LPAGKRWGKLGTVTAAALALLAALARPSAGPGASTAAPAVRTGVVGCKRIALTFDLCPVRNPVGFDAALVELLTTSHTPATFFASGRWMTKHDDRVAELLAVPYFELGTHGAVHAHLHALARDQQREEIAGAVKQLDERHGRHATLFRPPYGELDETTQQVAASLGQTVVLWSAVSGDPNPHLAAKSMLAALRPQLRDGTIIVMHANGKGVHTRELVEMLLPAIASGAGMQRLVRCIELDVEAFEAGPNERHWVAAGSLPSLRSKGKKTIAVGRRLDLGLDIAVGSDSDEPTGS
jgi:peptidoglycan/xylan/chitin deacetylase (PgdA/CDA1 family)